MEESEARCQNRHFDFVAHSCIGHETPFEIWVAIEARCEMFYFAHFVYEQGLVGLRTTSDGHGYTRGPEDVFIIEQGRIERIANGSRDALRPCCVSRRYDGQATLMQNHIHIAEVEVDTAAHFDDFHNTSDSFRQRFVGFLKGIDDGEVRIDFSEPFVVDDEYGIDLFGQPFDAV